MPKAHKKPKAVTKAASKTKPLYAIAPWSCVHHPDHSEIQTYVEAAGDWQTIADVRHTGGFTAETMANFIIRVVNDYEATQHLIDDMIGALETCLECKALDWAAEHDVEIVLRRARAIRGLLPPASAAG